MPGMNQPSIPPSQGVAELLAILEVVQDKDQAKSVLSAIKAQYSEIQKGLEESASQLQKLEEIKMGNEKAEAELNSAVAQLQQEKQALANKASEIDQRGKEIYAYKKQFELDAEQFKEQANAQVEALSKREQQVQKDSLVAETAKIEYEKLLAEYQEKMAKLKALAGG